MSEWHDFGLGFERVAQFAAQLGFSDRVAPFVKQ